MWFISLPSRTQMERKMYKGTFDITLCFTWNFQSYLAKGSTNEYTKEKHSLVLAPNRTMAWQLASLLKSTSEQSVTIPNIFPKYICAPSGLESNPWKQPQPSEEADNLDTHIHLGRIM